MAASSRRVCRATSRTTTKCRRSISELPMARPTRERPGTPKAILQIQDLQVYRGESHTLQGVSLVLEGGVLSVVGRNGMGKTTLCNAITGVIPARSGSVR